MREIIGVSGEEQPIEETIIMRFLFGSDWSLCRLTELDGLV